MCVDYNTSEFTFRLELCLGRCCWIYIWVDLLHYLLKILLKSYSLPVVYCWESNRTCAHTWVKDTSVLDTYTSYPSKAWLIFDYMLFYEELWPIGTLLNGKWKQPGYKNMTCLNAYDTGLWKTLDHSQGHFEVEIGAIISEQLLTKLMDLATVIPMAL